MGSNNTRATMGFIGSVQVNDSQTNNGTFNIFGQTPIPFRAANCDLKATQDLEMPALVSGRFDKTVVNVKEVMVGGSVTFPAILGVNGVTTNESIIMQNFWTAAMTRDNSGLLPKLDYTVKYGGPAARNYSTVNADLIFVYTQCSIDSMSLEVSKGGPVNCTTNVIGVDRINIDTNLPAYSYPSRNVRQANWADVYLGFLLDDTLGTSVSGAGITDFKISVNNGIQRFFTFNRRESAQDIAAGQRSIEGSFTALGRIENIANNVYRVPPGPSPSVGGLPTGSIQKCYFASQLWFSFKAANCPGGFGLNYPGIAFTIEEMSLTPEILQSSVKFYGMAGSPQQTGFITTPPPAGGESVLAGTDPVTFLNNGTVPVWANCTLGT